MARLGRPPKAERFKSETLAAEQKIVQKLPLIVDKMLELCEGVLVQVTEWSGQKKVYEKPPDRNACEYLLNRIMGKPTERVESDQAGQVTIKLKYPDQAEVEVEAEADEAEES